MHTHTYTRSLLNSVADSLGEPTPKETREMSEFLRDIQKILRPQSESKNAAVVYSRLEGTQQQENGKDCGMFLLGHTDRIVRRVEIDFTQKDIPVMRNRIVLMLTCTPSLPPPSAAPVPLPATSVLLQK
jgi:Ulp1 family protease